jgi:hypothetical protein
MGTKKKGLQNTKIKYTVFYIDFGSIVILIPVHYF